MSPAFPSSTVLFVRLVGIAGNGDEGYAFRKVHELDTHCVPVSRPAHRLHRSSDYTAVGRDSEQLVVRADHYRADQTTPTLGNLRGQHALAPTSLDRVLVDRRAFGEPTVGGHEHV